MLTMDPDCENMDLFDPNLAPPVEKASGMIELIRLMQKLCRVIIREVPRNNSTICVHELCQRYLDIDLDVNLSEEVSIILTVLYTLIIIMALVGNSCVIFIYALNRMARTTANMFIVSLSVTDLMITMFCMPINLSFVRGLGWHLGDFACRFVPFIQNVAVQSNSHTLVLIALDRYVAILHPMKSHTIHSLPKGFVLVSVIWVIATIVSIPNWFFFTLITPFKSNQTHSKAPQQFCMISESLRPRFEIYRWCMLVIILAVPLAVMLVSYIRIGHRLWSRGGIGVQIIYMEEARKRIRKRVVVMLILVMALFFCSWVPTWTLEMVALRSRLRANRLNLTIRCFLVWLAMSNSAHNPIVYTFLHDKFRKLFFPNVICCKNRVHVLDIQRGTANKVSTLNPQGQTEENTIQSSNTGGNKIIGSKEIGMPWSVGSMQTTEHKSS